MCQPWDFASLDFYAIEQVNMLTQFETVCVCACRHCTGIAQALVSSLVILLFLLVIVFLIIFLSCYLKSFLTKERKTINEN